MCLAAAFRLANQVLEDTKQYVETMSDFAAPYPITAENMCA